MIKLTTLTILLTFLLTVAFAQLQDYDISKYAPTNQKYQRLDAELYLNGDFYKVRSEDSRKINSRFSLDYFQYRNHPKYQGYIDITSDFGFRKSNVKNLAQETNLRNHVIDIKLFTNNQFFIRQKRFIEFDPFVATQFLGSTQNIIKPASIKDKTKSSNFRLSTPILFGFGRIYDVTDHWKAVRMLSEFQKENLLDRQLNDQDITNLADILAQRRYTRRFDFREKQKEDLEAIHNYLSQSNIINNNSIACFTTLEDMWSYGINTSRRLTGFSFALGVEPQIDYRYYKNDNQTPQEGTRQYLTGYLSAKTIYEKPINQKLQLSINSNIKFGDIYEYRSKESKKYVNKGHHLVPYVNIGIGYYPNTRTSLSTGISTNSSLSRTNLYATWYGAIHYYISPQTRLHISTNYRLTRGDPFGALQIPASAEDYYTNFRARLTHSFL